MKKPSRFLAGILCGLMAFTLFTGCGQQAAPSASSQEPATQTTPADSKTHTVTDNGGNVVEVPNEINRIVILGIAPLPSVYCMLAESADEIVGMSPASKNAAINSLLVESYPKLADVETSFVQGDSINVEELLALQPDVIFYRLETEADVQAVSKLDIPAVGFSTTLHNGDTIQSLNSWVQLLADVMNQPKILENAQALIQYGEDVQKQVSQRVSSLSPEERTSAMIIYNYGNAGLQAAGNTFGKYYLTAVNANNVTASLDSAFPQINLEQLYAWNPEVIFLNSFTSYSPQDLMSNNAMSGDDWSGLAAIQSGRIYKFPIGMYYWFPPSSDAPLSVMWVAKNLYPELFEDVDMEEMTTEYYQKFYGIELTPQQLDIIFNPPAEAAFVK